MAFVNGELQAQFMARVRGVEPQRCLVVPVDVGKSSAVALVADHYGEIVVAPFEFGLTEAGFSALAAAFAGARSDRDAVVVRVGVEAAGHYHRTLVARLRSAGLEVVELNPGAVKDARPLRAPTSGCTTRTKQPTPKGLGFKKAVEQIGDLLLR